jgi:hypothetical protein
MGVSAHAPSSSVRRCRTRFQDALQDTLQDALQDVLQ